MTRRQALKIFPIRKKLSHHKNDKISLFIIFLRGAENAVPVHTLTLKALVRTLLSPRGICGVERGTGKAFPLLHYCVINFNGSFC
jgi:hypothetical protein